MAVLLSRKTSTPSLLPFAFQPLSLAKELAGNAPDFLFILFYFFFMASLWHGDAMLGMRGFGGLRLPRSGGGGGGAVRRGEVWPGTPGTAGGCSASGGGRDTRDGGKGIFYSR